MKKILSWIIYTLVFFLAITAIVYFFFSFLSLVSGGSSLWTFGTVGYASGYVIAQLPKNILEFLLIFGLLKLPLSRLSINQVLLITLPVVTLVSFTLRYLGGSITDPFNVVGVLFYYIIPYLFFKIKFLTDTKKRK